MQTVTVPLSASEAVRQEAVMILRTGTPEDDGSFRWFLVVLRRAINNVRRQESWRERTNHGIQEQHQRGFDIDAGALGTR